MSGKLLTNRPPKWFQSSGVWVTSQSVSYLGLFERFMSRTVDSRSVDLGFLSFCPIGTFWETTPQEILCCLQQLQVISGRMANRPVPAKYVPARRNEGKLLWSPTTSSTTSPGRLTPGHTGTAARRRPMGAGWMPLSWWRRRKMMRMEVLMKSFPLEEITWSQSSFWFDGWGCQESS